MILDYLNLLESKVRISAEITIVSLKFYVLLHLMMNYF